MKRFALLILSCFTFSGCVVLLPFVEPYEAPPSPYATRVGATQTLTTKERRRVSKMNRYIAQLEDSKATVRTAAASYLGMMGADAAPAVGPLTAKLTDESKFVRRAAAKALGRIGAPAVPSREALKATTRDKDPYVAKTAQWALAQLGPGETGDAKLSPTGRSPMYSNR